jgi:hypothetical protein
VDPARLLPHAPPPGDGDLPESLKFDRPRGANRRKRDDAPRMRRMRTSGAGTDAGRTVSQPPSTVEGAAAALNDGFSGSHDPERPSKIRAVRSCPGVSPRASECIGSRATPLPKASDGGG